MINEECVNPLPFDPPKFTPARRVPGAVSLDDNINDDMVHPPSLVRRQSCLNNVLAFDNKRYWIQRKIGKTSLGSVRVGFLLDPNTDSLKVATPFQMVAIKMLDKRKVLESSVQSRHDVFTKSATVELSALQMIGEHDHHVMGSKEILSDDMNVYIIMPYYGDGTLFQYVEEMGTLEEGVARHFFRQVLLGLESLQRLGLSHRSLSLDRVLLKGTGCCISHLGNAVRVPSIDAMLSPKGACCGHPQYMAPEILKSIPYNGYAVDLWAAGVMLLAMLFGNGAPFVWAAPDDARFRVICVKGKLKSVMRRFFPDHNVSNPAMELLQNMLRANPNERPNLQQVMNNPWVMEGDEDPMAVAPPSISDTIKKINLGTERVWG